MKSFPKVFVIIGVIFILNIQIKAQQSKIDFDGLIIGKSYKVLIENGWETEGKLTKIDSNSIDIRADLKIFTIQKNEIEQIVDASSDFKEYYLPVPTAMKYTKYKSKVKKDKLYLSLGSGVNFTTSGYDNSYNPGVNIQLNLMKNISPGYAIRGDFQFGQNPKKSYESDYGGYGYYKTEGGNINNYSLKFDFLLGALDPSSTINGYGILGGGFNLLHESETKSTSSYQEYNYYTGEYTSQSYSYTDKGYSLGEMILEFGGGLGYKISNKLRLYAEAQYSFPILFLGYGGFYPESFLYGIPTLKIGAQIGL